MHLNAFERQPGILEEMAIPADFRMAGWVYILSNEYMPGIFKVGMTTTSPEIRAKELSSATGVPYPFKVEAAFHCEDPSRSEREIHEALNEVRINESREFFKDDLDEIKYECECLCEAKVDGTVEDLAMTYSVISFEKLSNLNLPDLFEDIGISVFGDRLAIAERLIRIGAQVVNENFNTRGLALVFEDNKAFAVMDAETSFRIKEEEALREWEAKQIAAGIYGPQLPPVEEPIPF
ncbi:TPA: GIY-YIG nuclease family protein [Citrobacter freundii]|nr:GIY-YIG nuclease family protein [Citrobacter freundii]